MDATDPQIARSKPGEGASAGLAAYRRHRRRVRRRRWAVLDGALVVMGVTAVWALGHYAFQFYRVPSASMEPNLVVGDRILVQKLGVNVAGLHPGDIVVFKRPATDHADTSIEDVVKRIVATPGEVVGSAGGQLLVDGRVVPEPYLPKGTVTSGVHTEVVPAGDYYVMGDNRQDSYDSRFFGPIPEHLVVGRVLAQVWPPWRFDLF